jgi:hypothetical protein
LPEFNRVGISKRGASDERCRPLQSSSRLVSTTLAITVRHVRKRDDRGHRDENRRLIGTTGLEDVGMLVSLLFTDNERKTLECAREIVVGLDPARIGSCAGLEREKFSWA